MVNKFYLLAIIISAVGIILAILYLSSANQMDSKSTIPTATKLTQDDALRIVEHDLESRDGGYSIAAIVVNSTIANNTLTYVPFEQFKEQNLKLPLVYAHPNGTVLRIYENGHFENMGKCNTGLSTYCGYLPPFNFDYKGRLVYGAEVLASSHIDANAPLLYIIDAENGKIVDSTFIRISHNAQ